MGCRGWLLLILVWGCAEDRTRSRDPAEREADALPDEGDRGSPPDRGFPLDRGVPTDRGVPIDRGAPFDGHVLPALDAGSDATDQGTPIACNAVVYQDVIYDCGALDLCVPENQGIAEACCACDPTAYCEPCPDMQAELCEVGDVRPPGGGPEEYAPPEGEPPEPPRLVESCMSCHNGAQRENDYSGPGITHPHPFRGADEITCSQCHGGDPQGIGPLGSHVPRPPAIGDDQNLVNNPIAYFNFLTHTGIDKLRPAVYQNPNTGDRQWTNLDYLQFMNPGDLRVVAQGRGCGAQGCHFDEHRKWVTRSLMATSAGVLSSARFLGGANNRIVAHQGLDGDTLAGVAPRSVTNPNFDWNDRMIGEVGRLVEQRELARFNGPMRDNPMYDATTLADHLDAAGRIEACSPLDELWDQMVTSACGNCHLYSAGANNRYGDFRSAGCSACHMQYAMDGKSRSRDRNLNTEEPLNPDAIVAPERPHIESHLIRSVARILPVGTPVPGIQDEACVRCHQGSNGTVLQYWGIRSDQNKALTRNFQYPLNPATFADAEDDNRLYPAASNNDTYNGRDFEQHIILEDHDADGRDDTPPDVHYERGMGCIDCHGGRDVHGGMAGDPSSGKIVSRQDQGTAIGCESCHGTATDYIETAPCTDHTGAPRQCAVDRRGNPLRHVHLQADGDVIMVSRLTGNRHYVPQTFDIIVDTGKVNPLRGDEPIYNPAASYAMGRADGDAGTGIGPQQADPNGARVRQQNFSHLDRLDCAACHASWTNNCIGCHLKNQYNVDPNTYLTSNLTGQRILLAQANADFVYQSPVMMYLGVNSRGKITQMAPAEKVFYRYQDLNGNESPVIAFGGRRGNQNAPGIDGKNAYPALAMNQMAPHSIRGTVTEQYEGPRYCVACHLNREQLDLFGDVYADFVDAYRNNNFGNLDFDLLATHIGANPGNQINSPIFVHMAAGRGTGLFLFDENGCPVNPLDADANRQNCGNVSPRDRFDVATVAYDLDRFAEPNGVNNAGSMHPLLDPDDPDRVRRTEADDGDMAGTLPAPLIRLMSAPAVGLILDTWFDANGQPQGRAAEVLP